MITITLTTKINRPLERVFAYTTNRANLLHWFAGVHQVVQDEPNRVGTRATITAQLLGLPFSFTSEIVAYEPNRTYAVKADKPFPLLESETFTQQGDSTQIDYHGTFYMPGFSRIMNPLLHWLFKRQLATSFRKLRDVLESDEVAGMQRDPFSTSLQ
jgi:uncharacterized protein YndB with AHSA1/START domain